MFLTWIGGERRVLLERWDGQEEEWVTTRHLPRALGGSANGVVTISVHRSRGTGSVARFGPGLPPSTSPGPNESVFEEEDEVWRRSTLRPSGACGSTRW